MFAKFHAHIIGLTQDREDVAAQAASETGLSVQEYLNRVIDVHLQRIEPTLNQKPQK